MRLAQKTAFEKKKNVEVLWRGHTVTVEASGPEFETEDLRGHLLLALSSIKKLHKLETFAIEEEKV